MRVPLRRGTFQLMRESETRPLHAWASGAAAVALAATLALWGTPFVVGSSGPSANFGPAAFWALVFGATAGVACLTGVVLAMEYRVRTLGNRDPRRRRKLVGVWALLALPLLHAIAVPSYLLYEMTL